MRIDDTTVLSMAHLFKFTVSFMELQELLQKIENELKLRNYSHRTIKSYLLCLSDYFKYIKNIAKNPDVEIIKKYLLEKQAKRQSSQTINLYLNAIKYFYREIYKCPIIIDVKFAKTSSIKPSSMAWRMLYKLNGLKEPSGCTSSPNISSVFCLGVAVKAK